MNRLINIVAIVLLTACTSLKSADNDEIEWSLEPQDINDQYADVLWFSGTVVNEEFDEKDEELYIITLTDEQKPLLKRDALFARKTLFPDSVNMFSPFYHQFTMNSITLGEERFDSLLNVVEDEAYAIFHNYMKNVNNGRPFVLAGMSQGAMMVRGILERMTDEEYSEMVCAYMIGYGLSDKDLQCKHIKPAQSAGDKGVTVSFNSVASHEGIWSLVHNNAAVCMNPVTWTNDTTCGILFSKNDTLTVQRDTTYNVLILKGESSPALMPLKTPWAKDNRHLSDYFVYADFIRRNVLYRVYK